MAEQEILQILAEFGDLVQDHHITKNTAKNGQEYTDVRLVFKDGSKMKAFFVFIKTKLELGYSFQWMHADNTLIIRWDNTPHPHKVATMPYHQHVGSNQNVQPSEPMDLRKVLAFIAKIIGIFLLIGLTAIFAFAQEPAKTPEKPKRRLSFSELFKEIENCKDTVYRLENAVLYYDSLKDEDRYWTKYFEGVNPDDSLKNVEAHKKISEIRIKKALYFKQVEFEGNLRLRKIIFEKELKIEKCIGEHISWYFCQLTDLFIIDSNFQGVFFAYSETNNFQMRGGTANYMLAINFSVIKERIRIGQAKIKLIEFSKNKFFSDSSTSYISNIEIERLYILKCHFFTKKQSRFSINTINIQSLEILDNYFESNISITRTTIRGYFELNKNIFRNKILLGWWHCPMNSSIDWKFIQGRLYVNSSFTFDKIQDFDNLYLYKELIATYNQLLSVFKYRGDMDSYNACYVEMKTLETRKSAYEYRQNPSLKTFLDWQMNEFLHTFSDYGTDYVKSLIYAFYVILGFAGFYFIFPSQEDNLSKNRFLKFFTQAIEYFRTDKQLLDFQQDQKKEELEKLENFKQNLISSQSEIPKIIALLGKPFYYQNLYFTEFSLWLLHRTDLAKGKWAEIPAQRKLFLGTLVTIYFVFYVLNGVFMRTINAFALSLNFFTTLGYGEMQAKGWIKYLAVLEGAVGWFLLTVFSASLVSQLLQ